MDSTQAPASMPSFLPGCLFLLVKFPFEENSFAEGELKVKPVDINLEGDGEVDCMVLVFCFRNQIV